MLALYLIPIILILILTLILILILILTLILTLILILILVLFFINIRSNDYRIQHKNDNQKDFFTVTQTKTEELNEFAIRSAYPSIQLSSKSCIRREHVNYGEKYQIQRQGEQKSNEVIVKKNIDTVIFSSQNDRRRNDRMYDNKNENNNDNYNCKNTSKNNNDNNKNDDDDTDDDVIIIIDSDSDVEIRNNTFNNIKNSKINKSNNFQKRSRMKNSHDSPIGKFLPEKNDNNFQNQNENSKMMTLNDEDDNDNMNNIKNSRNYSNDNNNDCNSNYNNKNERENENENEVFRSRIILIEDTPHLLQRLFNTDNAGVKRGSGGGDISEQNSR